MIFLLGGFLFRMVKFAFYLIQSKDNMALLFLKSEKKLFCIFCKTVHALIAVLYPDHIHSSPRVPRLCNALQTARY